MFKIVLLILFTSTTLSQAVSYSCCFFQNNYESAVSAVSCTNQYCPNTLIGWTMIGLKQTTSCFLCTNHLSEVMNVTKGHEDFNDHMIYHDSEKEDLHNYSKRVEDDEELSEFNSNYHCCVYSSPESSYYWPIYTYNANPSSGHDCPSSLYGETLLGTWYTASLYDQCYFVLRY
jgi:hypothetical protein